MPNITEIFLHDQKNVGFIVAGTDATNAEIYLGNHQNQVHRDIIISNDIPLEEVLEAGRISRIQRGKVYLLRAFHVDDSLRELKLPNYTHGSDVIATAVLEKNYPEYEVEVL